ncbi:MAG: lactate permease LctP family transporter [Acidobacteriota bacterium]
MQFVWQQSYTPLAGSTGWSALAAALPIFVLLFLLGIRRKPAWMAGLAGLAAAIVVAGAVYRMPPGMILSAALYGAAFGLFPIGWITLCAILLYRLTVETGQFELIRASIGGVTADRRLQALLIAFAFGAFIEGAAGSGVPVAVAAAMLAGLGFPPFHAAGICLLANTAPVAYGAIGTPILTLAGTTGLPLGRLSAAVGRICAPISLIVPAYLTVLMAGWRGSRSVIPAILVCGVSFATVQFLVSNFVGPQLTDILGSLAAMGLLLLLFRFWRPKDQGRWENTTPEPPGSGAYSRAQLLRAWTPYALLAACVLIWGSPRVHSALGSVTWSFEWPGLHNTVERIPPIVKAPAPYRAVYDFDWLACAGTACLIAGILAAGFLRVSPRQYGRVFAGTLRQMRVPLVTIAAVLGLAFLMNYSGQTATLGLAFAATGKLFPYFSSMLGWLGVFLTGSDTSSNALFGNLQVVAANRLGLNPILMASSNSSGGVMGKMISLQSIAVAVAATGMQTSDEAKLFRFTLRHSVLLASLIGLLTTCYAYVVPDWVP